MHDNKISSRMHGKDELEKDLRKLSIVNWRKKAEDRKVWRNVVMQDKTHPEL